MCQGFLQHWASQFQFRNQVDRSTRLANPGTKWINQQDFAGLDVHKPFCTKTTWWIFGAQNRLKVTSKMHTKG